MSDRILLLKYQPPPRRLRKTLWFESNPIRRGALTVELAMAAPILFLFIFASIEFGRLNILRHGVNNAAYEAARHGMVPGASVDEITAHALRHLNALSATGAVVQVTPSQITEETDQITVSVTVPFDQNSWIIPAFSSGAQIESSSSLHTERYRGIY